MKKIISLLIIVVFIIQSTGCINDPSRDHDITKQTTIRCAFKEEESISPVGFGLNLLNLLPNIYDSLVVFDETFQLTPALATSWSNPNEKTWRFHLRENVSFHDGMKFTADDVAFSLYQYSSFRSMIENISIIDSHTIDIVTINPEPSFLQRIAYNFFVYPYNYSLIENDYQRIGTGPYQIDEFVEGNYTKLTLFEDYWGEKPSIETIYYYVIEDEKERLDKLVNDELDLIEYNIEDDIETINDIDSVKIVKYSPLSTYFLGFDLLENSSSFPDGKNPTANLSVRKAIYHAINITEIINGPFQGFALPATQLLSSYHFGYNPSIQRLRYDVELAKSLLNESGYPNGFDIELDAITVGYEFNRLHAELIKEQLSRIGINVTINQLNTSGYNEKVTQQKNSSFWLIGWTYGMIDGGHIYPYYIMSEGERAQGYYNSGHYSNPQVDEIGFEMRYEMDTKKRNELIQEGFRIAFEEDVVFVPLVIQELIIITQDDLSLKTRADSKLIIKDVSFER
jgi:peptide/nickel transport system substrate-binding protein